MERYAGLGTKRNHPGHYPFISFLSFRNFSDHAIDDDTEWFDPDSVELGDIIYVNVWYLDWFFWEIHNHIKCPYILISADVGGWLPHPVLNNYLYDPKLAAWFCRNLVFSNHPKLYQIPMGPDFGLFWLTDLTVSRKLLNAMAGKPYEKKHLLYMNHTVRNHCSRDKIVEMFENASYCYSRNTKERGHQTCSVETYYDELAQSKFTLSPIGLETDCLRTWEALALDCIPIVEHTFLDPLFDRLPVVMVHNWEEITEEFLLRKYEELKDKKCDFSSEAFMPFWQSRIKDVQKKIRRKETSFSQLSATEFCQEDLSDFEAILTENQIDGIPLIYKGFLSTVRPLQIVDKMLCISEIDYRDPWFDDNLYNELSRIDRQLIKNKGFINILKDDNSFMGVIKKKPGSPVFLDLTYYRASLFLNFSKSIIEYGNFRHSLLMDLMYLYWHLAPNTLLIGNMASNGYVKEVLEKFVEGIGVPLVIRGNFWYMTRDFIFPQITSRID